MSRRYGVLVRTMQRVDAFVDVMRGGAIGGTCGKAGGRGKVVREVAERVRQCERWRKGKAVER